jgi:hypothetical protein
MFNTVVSKRDFNTAQVLTVVTILVGIAHIYVMKEHNQELKSVDVMLAFTDRYQGLLWVDRQLVAQGLMLEEEYYFKYWDLQLDQYHYWKRGYVDPTTFSYWMDSRYADWNENQMTGQISYQEGWRMTKDRLQDPDFSRFIDQVVSGNRGVYE